jgi:ATP-dependent RNA helicase RhlE
VFHLTYQDKTCACRDCAQTFTFPAQQQEDYEKRGFNPPARCPECHTARITRRNHRRAAGRPMHTDTCAVCGKNAELPFVPTANKPVYCAECYQAQLRAKEAPVEKEFTLRESEPACSEIAEQVVINDGPTFADFKLDPKLERAVREAGYETPTPVQLATIPTLLEGRDVIGTAQTGTGKTAAFVLPILQHLLANPVAKRCTRVIVLTPTRELAEQVNQSFRQMARFTNIKCATVYGGVGMIPQENALRGGTEVIVACPGRLLDHIDRGNTNFSHVEKVVLDEADRMLDMGFLPYIQRVLSFLPRERHTMLFSATFAPELMRLAKNAMNNPERIDVDLQAPPHTVAHALYPCPQHLKTSLVLRLLDGSDANSVLIFTRTKHRANRVAEQIEKAGYGTVALHSNKSQNQRQLALDDFRRGRRQILVATDIAARGLDVETISHVINYDIPDTADTYIHRIGRTGRMEREGDAMTLVTREDSDIIWDIEKALGGPIERRELEDFDYRAPAPPRDEFKRGPMPPRRDSTPRMAPPTAFAKSQTVSPAQGMASPKSSGRPTGQRGFRGKRSGD